MELFQLLQYLETEGKQVKLPTAIYLLFAEFNGIKVYVL